MYSYTTAGNTSSQPDLLARLQNVVRQLNRHDIRTVTSLIGKIINDQPAAAMMMRLLYWFPRSRNTDGWVYKSWRDWNAECNLSQAQVKRIHSQCLLEPLGISRRVMKANGTPTMHYRLDEDQLIKQIACYLNEPPSRVRVWMQVSVEGQTRPTQVATSTQPDGVNQPIEKDAWEPMNSAQTAKSITGNYKQELHQENQQKQQQVNNVVVADTLTGEHKLLLERLTNIGIPNGRALVLAGQYGWQRLQVVVTQAEKLARTNPAGYVLRALQAAWQFAQPSCQQKGYGSDSGLRYITGKYAEFIEH